MAARTLINVPQKAKRGEIIQIKTLISHIMETGFRHDNVGHGQIGEAPFARLLARAELRDVPFVLEVPGFDDSGPDRPNIESMKRLRAQGSQS